MAPGGRDKAVHDVIWDEHFQAFKAYYEAHGSYPPKKNDTEKLARWVYKQRCRAKNNRLSSRRIARLNALNFDWGFPLSSIKPMRAPVAPRTDASVSGHEHDAVEKHDSEARPDAKNSSRASRGRLDFQFNVTIPSHYKDISEGAKNSFSFHEAILDDAISETKGEERWKAETSDCISKTTNDATPPNLTAERTKQHKDFTSALEKYGSNAVSKEGTVAWQAMATALKWSIKDVKIYAYSYFKALTEGNLQAGGSENSDIKGTATGAASGIQSSWTCDELVLLDSLMLKYCKCLNDLKYVHGDRNSSGSSYLIRTPSAWENIAASLPGKTSKECYEMGTSRLSALDINNNMEDRNLMPDTDLLNPRQDILTSKVSPELYIGAAGLTQDDDLSTVASRQQRLLVLRHSSICKAENGKCPEYSQCTEMQELWKHMNNCKARSCAVKYCMSSRHILRHYLNCKDDCETCSPLKEKTTNVYN